MRHLISTEVQGMFLTEENGGGPTFDWLVIGFHGFGELADKQLERITSVSWPQSTLCCSIQALHPMFNKDDSPGASWMTFLERERVINDNINYVRKVIRTLKESYSWSKLAFCGFSQGASMAHRAVLMCGEPCDLLITAGGDVPPEFMDKDLSAYPQTVIARGIRDRLYRDATFNNDLECMKKNNIDVSPLILKGGHKWPVALTEHMAELTRTISAKS